jgi:glycosyltransferase involved in cell wall biosynthesis
MQKNNRTILLLCPYPYGHAPSQRFRFEQYLDALKQHNFHIDAHSFLSEGAWRILYTRGHVLQKTSALVSGFLRRFGLLFRSIPKADLVFIHREASPLGPPLLEFIIAKVYRKKIIYDFDDAIWLPNTSEENRLVAWFKWHSKVKSICRWSYRVSAGNAFLASFARSYNANVFINPTTVDSSRIHIPSLATKSGNQNLTLGWTGTHSTLKYLDFFGPIWSDLVLRFGARIQMIIISDRRPSYAWPQLHFIPWSKETEIEDLRQIDIGLMPLTNDPWTAGKCGLKVLQYMALAIPAVASPVGVNTTIISDGHTGVLCDSAEQWSHSLIRLIEDSAWRKTLGIAGREWVAANYSVESNRSNFVSLFR